MDIKPIKKRMLVSMNGEFNDRIKLGDDNELYLDTSYEYYEHANQNGVARYLSNDIIKEGINEGDRVWFHHFIPVDQTELSFKPNFDEYLFEKTGERLYWININDEHLFAYENEGVIKCFRDNVIVKKIIVEANKTESGIITDPYETKEVFEKGEIVISNKVLEANGFFKGDIVKFTKDSEYELKIDDNIFYKMTNRDVVFKYI